MSHPYCSHIGYSLNCAEYEGLLAMAQGCCMICKKPAAPLYIDHDHKIGRWAVRGLVCHGCNQRLRRVDSGEKAAVTAIARYLADAWHLHQPRSAIKKARMRPIAGCPACGRDVAIKLDGNLWHHWSRLPGERRPCMGSWMRPMPATTKPEEGKQR